LRANLSLNNAEKSTKLLAGKTVGVPGATPVLAPQESMSRAKGIQIICDAWPDEPEEHALVIAQRESILCLA
jgi:hypothetical protein